MLVCIDMGIIYIDIYRLHQTPMANRRIRTLDSKKKISLLTKGYPHADTTSSVNDDKNYYNYITISV